MADGVFIGIEIGGTKLQLVRGDACALPAESRVAKVDRAGGGPGICRQIVGMLGNITGGRAVAGLGAGFGGPIDRRNGRVARSHQIDGWENFELQSWLAEQAGGAPVALENDSNAAALGEALDGAGKGFERVFYCNFGSGVGGGLVSGGDVYHGAPPGEMEFGHLRLGRGEDETVEARCSGWAADARIRALCDKARASALARLVAMDPAGGEARHLAPALAAGDDLARRIIDDLAGDIAMALSHVVHLVHPDVLVIGGGLSLVGEPLRRAVADALPPLVMRAFHPLPDVRLAQLGQMSVPVGALHLALRAAGIVIAPREQGTQP